MEVLRSHQYHDLPSPQSTRDKVVDIKAMDLSEPEPCFFTAWQEPRLDTQANELEQSRRRSHTAKHVHAQRRKARRSSLQSTATSVTVELVKHLEHEAGANNNTPSSWCSSPSTFSQISGDPFGTSCIGPIDPFVQNALNYGCDIYWPDSAVEPHEIGVALYAEQRRQTLHCPFYMHIYIAIAAGLWLHLHQISPHVVRQKMLAVRRRHTLKALQMMEEAAQSQGADQYSVLLTTGAFGLACQPHLDGKALPSRFPESPLADVQHLDAYGSMEILPGFTETVVKWVRRNGGLEKLIVEGHQEMVRIMLL